MEKYYSFDIQMCETGKSPSDLLFTCKFSAPSPEEAEKFRKKLIEMIGENLPTNKRLTGMPYEQTALIEVSQ